VGRLLQRGMEARTRTGTRLDCVCVGEGEWGNTSDESDYPIFPIHVHTGPFFFFIFHDDATEDMISVYMCM